MTIYNFRKELLPQMFRNKEVIQQFVRISLGEILCVALMLIVYALLGRFTTLVLTGALLGCALAILNFFLLCVAITRAADRAETSGNAAKATMSVRASAVYRLLGMAVILFLAFRAGLCDPIAALLPLVFMQLCMNIIEFFRRDGGKKQ